MILTNYENSLSLTTSEQYHEVQILKGNDNQLWHGDILQNYENLFTIQNKQSLRCLSVSNNYTNDNKSFSTSCNLLDKKQLFEFIKIPKEKIQSQNKKILGQMLINSNSGLCLSRTNPPRLLECNADLNQLWINNKSQRLITSYDKKEFLKFSKDNLHIEITNSTIFEDGTTKIFQFKSVTTKDYFNLENLKSEKCLGTNEEDIYDPKVFQVDCNPDSKFQLFKFIDIDSYDYSKIEFFKSTKKYPFVMKNVYLKNSFSNKCLKFDGINKPILNVECKNSEEFQWKIQYFGNENFYLTTKSEKYLLISRKSLLRGEELFAVLNSEEVFDNLTLQFFKLKEIENFFLNYHLKFNDFGLCPTMEKHKKKISLTKCWDMDKDQYISIVNVDYNPLNLNDKGIIPPYALPFV